MLKLPSAAGVGLRTPHLSHILNNKPVMPWFELLIDNWLAEGGFHKYALDLIAERYPISFHGVNLSLGSKDPLDYAYLKRIKTVLDRTNACCYSEHCSFTSIGNQGTPDLLPMPYTDEAILHTSKRITEVQEILERTMMIENVSCYIECPNNSMRESQFLAHILKVSQCNLLLDLNNVYVNSVNHNFCASTFINDLPLDKVKEVHLAGFEPKQGFLLDCHNNPVSENVWQLYSKLLKQTGPIPTLIEWDNNIPDWEVLVSQQAIAQKKIEQYTTKKIT